MTKEFARLLAELAQANARFAAVSLAELDGNGSVSTVVCASQEDSEGYVGEEEVCWDAVEDRRELGGAVVASSEWLVKSGGEEGAGYGSERDASGMRHGASFFLLSREWQELLNVGGLKSAGKTSMRGGWLMATAVVALVAAAAFSPWIFSGKVLAPLDIVEEMFLPWRGEKAYPAVHNHFVSDAVTQYLPYLLVASRSFDEDGYLGWNPLVFGGVPQSANTMALGADWGTQLHRFFGFWTAWHLALIGRFLLAGIGMMVFLRSRGCSAWLATALGVAYMLNTEFVSWIYHQWALASFCWMPWFLWALHKAREVFRSYTGLAAVFLGLAVLGATLQHMAFLAIAVGCIWVGWLLEARRGEEAENPDHIRCSRSPGGRARDTGVVMTAGLLAAGLAAFMLEPTIASYLENLRAGHERGGFGYTHGLSQPLKMVLAWPWTLYPFVLGSVQTVDLTKAFLPSGVAHAFFGTVPAVLAVVGLFSRRVPVAAKLLMVAGLIIPLTPLVGVLYQRVSLLWILGGCWAAGAWLSTAREESLRKFSVWCWRVLAVSLFLWTLASILLVVFREPIQALFVARAQSAAASSQFAIFPGWVQNRVAGLLDYLCVWNPWQLSALSGLILSLWGVVRCRTKSCWPGMAFAVGIALQLSVFWWQWTTWSLERDVYGQPEIVRILQQEVGASGRLAQGAGRTADLPFPPNTLIPSSVAITGGYDSIHPDGMKSPTGKPWDQLGTTHFLGRLDEDHPAGWQEAWSDGRWVLWRNSQPRLGLLTFRSGLPRALGFSDVKWNSLNTIEVSVPAGTARVEIFANWHRGWKWRNDREVKWSDSIAGSTKGIEVVLNRPMDFGGTVFLQFDPSPPKWALVVTGLSFMAVLLLALSRRPAERRKCLRRWPSDPAVHI